MNLQVLERVEKKKKPQIMFGDKQSFMPFWDKPVYGGLLDNLVKTEFEPSSKDESPQTNLLSYQNHFRAGLEKS